MLGMFSGLTMSTIAWKSARERCQAAEGGKRAFSHPVRGNELTVPPWVYLCLMKFLD